ncbi:MAG: AAA family ATPase [Fimbriiglobus sp.]
MPPVVKKQTITSGSSVSNGAKTRPVGSPAKVNLWDAVTTTRMMLYGESGSGKTTFWATFPGPIKVLVCSGGNLPGELKSVDTPENRQKIRPVLVSSSDELAGEMADARAGGYETVVLDHASGLADLVLKEILGLDELPAQKAWGLASQQQYGQQAMKLKEVFRAMLNMPLNVVVVCQQRVFTVKEENDKNPFPVPPTISGALSPSVVGWLAPACDYVVQTYVRPRTVETKRKVGDKVVVSVERGKGVDHCLRLEQHDVYQVKVRTPPGVVPQDLTDPTYDKFMAAVSAD